MFKVGTACISMLVCMGRGELHTKFCWGNLRERDHVLLFMFKKLNWGAWTGFIWLRIGIVGGHL
jgi:hypothetical protein